MEIAVVLIHALDGNLFIFMSFGNLFVISFAQKLADNTLVSSLSLASSIAVLWRRIHFVLDLS